jgi:hypothetical protein
MRTNRASLSISGVVIALSLVMAIPAWAGSGTPVSDTSGFGTSLGTTSNDYAGGDVNFNVTTTVYQCQSGSGCSGGGGTAANGEYTYVYSVTPLVGSEPLSLVTVGNLLGLFLSGPTNYGVVNSLTTMSNSGSTTFSFGSGAFHVTPPMCGGDSCLTVGTTLTFYVQSFGAPGNDNISAVDGGTAAGGYVPGPTPEPASMALFGSGLVLLAGAIRKLRHSS